MTSTATQPKEKTEAGEQQKLQPPPARDPNTGTRFKIGDRIQANLGNASGTGANWICGTVTKLWHHEQHWPASRPTAPYVVKLDNGRMYCVPQDDDRNIKAERRIPVTILTGFLGAGKTTLLNHILSAEHGKKIGIIENEFGAVSIDDKLIKQNEKRSSNEVVVEMKNGCICCTVRSDITTAINDMFKGGTKFDAIIIETTGMADPAPVIQTFCADEFAKTWLELDATITVVDAKHIEQHIDDEEYKAKGVEFENESVEQIAFADRILLNKIDLLPEENRDQAIERIKGRIKEINEGVEVIPCTLKDKLTIDLNQILAIKAFDLENILKIEPTFMEDEGTDHVHNPNINSFTMRYPGNVDWGRLNQWLEKMLETYSADIFRSKGFLSVETCPDKIVFQGVHMIFNLTTSSEPWKLGEPRENLLVFIGKKMKDHEQEFRKGFEQCLIKKKN